MDSGYYTSAIGMLNQFNIEDDISNNLANMQTPGFKERAPEVEDFSQTLLRSGQTPDPFATALDTAIGRIGLPPQISGYGLDLAQGAPQHTGSPLDLMIAGNAFFSVRNGNQTVLTRNGSFHRAANGQLVTADGYQVLNAAGRPITVPTSDFTVDRQGNVLVNNKQVDRLGLARVQTGAPLTDLGSGYYSGATTPVAAGAPNIAVLQGYVEGSNVDMAAQTSNLLSAQRAYQADSQMMQIQDSTLGLAVNDLGKVNA